MSGITYPVYYYVYDPCMCFNVPITYIEMISYVAILRFYKGFFR